MADQTNETPVTLSTADRKAQKVKGISKKRNKSSEESGMTLREVMEGALTKDPDFEDADTIMGDNDEKRDDDDQESQEEVEVFRKSDRPIPKKRLSDPAPGESPSRKKQSHTVNITNKAQIQLEFLESTESKAIAKFETFIKKCRANKQTVDMLAQIKPAVIETIGIIFKANGIKGWKLYSDEEFFRSMFRTFGSTEGTEKDAVHLEPVERMMHAFKNIPFRMDVHETASYADYMTRVIKIYKEFPDGEFSDEEEILMAKAMIENLPNFSEGAEKFIVKAIRDEVLLDNKANRKTVMMAINRIALVCSNVMTTHRMALKYQLYSIGNSKKKEYSAAEKLAYKLKQKEAEARNATLKDAKVAKIISPKEGVKIHQHAPGVETHMREYAC
jgi:hypothetical protein